MFNDLTDKGLFPRKSLKEKPYYDIRKELILHYIRGVFDADGSIRSNGNIVFVGSREMLRFIRDKLEEFGLSHAKVHKKQLCKCGLYLYYVAWYSFYDKERFATIIYNNSNSKIRLLRKYKKFLELGYVKN